MSFIVIANRPTSSWAAGTGTRCPSLEASIASTRARIASTGRKARPVSRNVLPATKTVRPGTPSSSRARPGRLSAACDGQRRP